MAGIDFIKNHPKSFVGLLDSASKISPIDLSEFHEKAKEFDEIIAIAQNKNGTKEEDSDAPDHVLTTLEKALRANDEHRRNARVAPDLIPHPLYVKLQNASPMGMMRDYNVTISKEGQELTRKQFYMGYVSKSLPVIFQQHARDWRLIKELRKARDSVDNYLTELFETDFSNRVGWIDYTEMKIHEGQNFTQGIG